jgi:hypothetical protein
MSIGGPIGAAKGWPGALADETAELDTTEERPGRTPGAVAVPAEGGHLENARQRSASPPLTSDAGVTAVYILGTGTVPGASAVAKRG